MAEDTHPGAEGELDILDLGAGTAEEARHFIAALHAVGTGAARGASISILQLALAQIIATGARLAATIDVVPDDRFEPDAGLDPDLEDMRIALHEQLGDLDEYLTVVDPMLDPELTRGQVSDDLAEIAANLEHGLRHFEQGAVLEALWWWQFSYVSTWGDSAMCALRALQSVLTHSRLDADSDVVAEAAFDALYT